MSKKPWILKSGQAFAICGLFLWLLACGGTQKSAETPAPSKGKAASRAATTSIPSPAFEQSDSARRSHEHEAYIAETESHQDYVRVKVRLDAGAKIPNRPLHFNFCLPVESRARLVLRDYRVGNAFMATGDNPSTGAQLTKLEINRCAKVDPQGYLRHWQVQQLTLEKAFWQPLRTHDAQMKEAFEAVIDLKWTENAKVKPWKGYSKTYERVVRQLVANPEAVAKWANPKPGYNESVSPQPTDPRKLAPAARRWAQLGVAGSGLIHLTQEALMAAGFAADPESLANLRLYAEGKPVALHLERDPARKGLYGAYFYARPFQSDYVTTATYWLADAAQAPARSMAVRDDDDATKRSRPLNNFLYRQRWEGNEELMLEHDNFLSIIGLEWVSAQLTPEEPYTVEFDLLPAYELNHSQATLKLEMYIQGVIENRNAPEIEVSFGGNKLGTIRLENGRRSAYELSFDQRILQPGSAQKFTFTLLSTEAEAEETEQTVSNLSPEAGSAALYLSSVELEYRAEPRLSVPSLRFDDDSMINRRGDYEISLDTLRTSSGQGVLALLIDDEGTQIEQLLPEGKLIPAKVEKQLRTEVFDMERCPQPVLEPVSWQAEVLNLGEREDYLIITHASLHAPLERLVALNKRRGLSTRIVDVDQLYTFFSHGNFSPVALRDYLGWRFSQGNAPDYVLLVGDSSSDYLGLTHSGVPNYVPSYSYQMGDNTWASDYWFSLILGNDDLPDLMLGRYSVVSPEDLNACLDKLEAYVGNQEWGPWRAEMVYVSDNKEGFRTASERARNANTPLAYRPDRIYLDALPFEDNWYIPMNYIERVWAMERSWLKVSRTATQAIKEAFDRGTGHLEFFGHGSPNIWTDERIWFGGGSPNRDSQHLEPQDGRFPFIVNYTCNSGAIDYPMKPWNICISEDMMREPERGTIGCLVPSGPGTTSEHATFAIRWREGLFSDNERGLGALNYMLHARQALDGASRALNYMYILLGDPALQLQLTRKHLDLKLASTSARPGTTIPVKLTGLEPAEGSFICWLEDDNGERLAGGETLTYTGGTLEAQLEIPHFEDPRRQTLRVFVYGWNEQAGKDFAAGATLGVYQPRLELTDASASDEGFVITVRNHDPLASAPRRLRVVELSGDAIVSVAEQEFSVGPNASEVLKLDVALGGVGAEPVFYKAFLPGADSPDLEDPATPAKLFARLPEGWLGFAAPMIQFERNDLTRQANVRMTALANVTERPEHLVSWQVDGASITTQTLAWKPDGDVWLAELTLVDNAGQSSEMRPGQLRLFEQKAGQATRQVASMSLEAMPALASRLRIKPGSVSHHPNEPSDGETIFIRCEVENIGQLPSERKLQPRLLEIDVEKNETELPRQCDHPAGEVPLLGPGRSAEIELRWDPRKNAGLHKLKIDLGNRIDRDAQTLDDETALHQLYVKTKYSLRRGKIGAKLWKNDEGKNRYILFAEVINTGQTPAHGVEVEFYIKKEQSPENLIATVLLPRVPAEGKARAEYKWDFKSGEFTANQLRQLNPSVSIGLKGSKQRFDMEEDEEEER